MRRRLLAALVGGALSLTACGGSPTASPDPTAASPASPTPTAASPTPGSADPPGAGETHPQLDLQAPLLDGGTFDGSVAGDVVLWFWAPW